MTFEPDPRSKYLGVYWLGVVFYAIAVCAFMCTQINAPKSGVAPLFLAIISLGPPLFYGTMYFVTSDPEERAFVKMLATVWGPFWVAASALAAFFSGSTG